VQGISINAVFRTRVRVRVRVRVSNPNPVTRLLCNCVMPTGCSLPHVDAEAVRVREVNPNP